MTATTEPQRHHDQPEDPLALLLLLRAPRAGWQQQLERALRSLTSSRLVPMPIDLAGVDPDQIQTLLPRDEIGIRHGDDETWFLAPVGAFTVVLSASPCFDDIDEVLRDIEEQRIRRAITEHRAYLSLTAIPFADPESLAAANAVLCRLAAELWDEDILAVHECATQQILPALPQVREQLAGGECPFGLHGDWAYGVCEDCVAAHAAQARARWPEFVAAFHARMSNAEFLVKHRLGPPDGPSELVWSTVQGLTGTDVHATLGSHPLDANLGRQGDAQRIAVADVIDWLYVSGTPPQPHGWFSRSDPNRPHATHR